MIAFKITVDYLIVVFSSPFFLLMYLRCIVDLVFVYVPEIITANICRIPRIPILAIKGTPADHDTQTWCLGSTLIWISHFSCVVQCGYNRPRGWLISVLLSQMWPGTLLKRTLKQNPPQKKTKNKKKKNKPNTFQGLKTYSFCSFLLIGTVV